MATDSMELVELRRKQVPDADVDFLREVVGVLVEAIMEPQVTAKTGARHGGPTSASM